VLLVLVYKDLLISGIQVRRVVLLLASFPGCCTMYSMPQKAGEKPGMRLVITTVRL